MSGRVRVEAFEFGSPSSPHRYQQEYGTSAYSRASDRTDTTWRYSVFGPERMGRGAMLFTGPDGIRDHRVSVDGERRYIGEGTMSPEGTSEVNYLWRASEVNNHFPRPKSQCVGEIGWGIPSLADRSSTLTGAQIELGEFRQAVEDRHTHLYQNAWYPGPDEEFPENSDAALVMNVYKKSSSTSSGQKTQNNQNRSGSAANTRSSSQQDSRPVSSSTGSKSQRHSVHSSRRESLASAASAKPDHANV